MYDHFPSPEEIRGEEARLDTLLIYLNEARASRMNQAGTILCCALILQTLYITINLCGLPVPWWIHFSAVGLPFLAIFYFLKFPYERAEIAEKNFLSAQNRLQRLKQR